ncbi:MAG: hypothetical protein WEB88_02635 [Gemmatimonadota bacterium]
MHDAAVTDLHGLVWWGLSMPHRFGAAGGGYFRRADAGRGVIHVPAFVLDQLALAEEQGLLRLDAPLAEFIDRLFSTGSYFPVSLTPEIITRAGTYPTSAHRADRLLAATAAELQRPLISVRREIGRWSGVQLLW